MANVNEKTYPASMEVLGANALSGFDMRLGSGLTPLTCEFTETQLFRHPRATVVNVVLDYAAGSGAGWG